MFLQTGDARPIADLEVPKDIANALTNLSDSLLTNRTLEAQTAAFTFNGLDFTAPAPPFQMLVDQLKQSYQQMAVYDPSTPRHQSQSLKAQYLQIKWYVEKQHYLQAITLMREWLISWRCLKDKTEWLNTRSRENAEETLSASSSSVFTVLEPAQVTASKLWGKCVTIRNDLAHCGMRYHPKISADAIEEIQDLFNKFEKFAPSNLVQ